MINIKILTSSFWLFLSLYQAVHRQTGARCNYNINNESHTLKSLSRVLTLASESTATNSQKTCTITYIDTYYHVNMSRVWLIVFQLFVSCPGRIGLLYISHVCRKNLITTAWMKRAWWCNRNQFISSLLSCFYISAVPHSARYLSSSLKLLCLQDEMWF